MLLSIDCATSTAGWSILDRSGNLIDYGYIDLRKIKTGLIDKLDEFKRQFKPILDKHKDHITKWGIEEALKKFMKGRSKSSVILMLASFNFGVSYFVYEQLGLKPVYIGASTAFAKTGLKVPPETPKKDRRGVKKEMTRKYCADKYPALQFDLNRNNNYQPWTFDICDAIIICEALLPKSKGVKNEKVFKRDAEIVAPAQKTRSRRTSSKG